MTLEQLRRGAEIFQKYVKKDESIDGADHDVIFFGSRDLPITDEDRKELDALGFHESDQYDCWIHYA